MTDYDLLVLSPSEFEDFSRDILQKKNNCFIESFRTGRDGGIDLRYTTEESKNIIIQAKRYSSYSNLLSNLKKEFSKVIKLNPDKYILTTTVDLTPNNKEEIIEIFKPYIKRTEDILGKKDLNNLISIYKEIENKYYKLWISSTNILNKVLHSKIYNQTEFELDDIKSKIKLYVQNDSFNKALETLNKHRYIIISGIPGIGKTTLSRILIVYLLANEFEEFVYLSDNIDDGYKFYKEDAKQIFFFDDFLGKNFFDAKDLPKNDEKIVKFIQKIKHSSDKVLIFATREYILNQAKLFYESFEISNIEIAKSILDLSTYTSIIKAKILYNHLYYGKIPNLYIENLLKNGNHHILINHKNYSPRIIETIINRKLWENCSHEHFFETIKDFFDNPQSVWLYAFENSLDKFSQFTLIVLASLGTPVLLTDLEKAMKEFSLVNSTYLISFDSIKFNRSIKELENTFIKTNADSFGIIAVEYQNPSIYDFIIHYLKGKTDIIESILKSSLFIEQFFTIFSTNNYKKEKIKLNKRLVNSSMLRICEVGQNLKTSNLSRYVIHDKIQYGIIDKFIFKFLNDIREEFLEYSLLAEDYIYENFQENIYKIKSLSYSENHNYLELLENLSLEKLEINEERLIDTYLETLFWTDDIDNFERFESIFPRTFNDTINTKEFVAKITEIIDYENENVEFESLVTLKERVKELQDRYSIDFRDILDELDLKAEELENDPDSRVNTGSGSNYKDEKSKIDKKIIDEIFNSLRE
ncbi:restriction endonuclease [Flavobacterium sp. MMS24-S5]|uniref:nSTAND3 domain-containing NTPase n=1 Tax=Flavobacterium sp. MMS24-S5 TaxID=3416605 RepID=UPI003D01D663